MRLRFIYVSLMAAAILALGALLQVAPVALAADTISISTPGSYTVIQRDDTNSASVVIKGNYSAGTYTAIQAQAVLMSGGNGVPVGWTTIVANPASAGGNYSGSLKLSAGGWYQLQVQLLSGSSVVATATVNKIGVGEVFLAAGQSNSANCGETKVTPADDRVAAMNYNTGGWAFGADPLPGADCSGGSPWTGMAELLHETLQVPIGLISTGKGSTSVLDWQPGGTLYPRISAALSKVGPKGIRAALWHQGEGDLSTDPAVYEAKLTNVINQSRTDGGWSIPWGIAQTGDAFDKNNQSLRDPAQVAAIAASQQKTFTDVANTFLGPNTNLLDAAWRYKNVDSNHPDGIWIHFNENGLREHGRQWYAILMNKYWPGFVLNDLAVRKTASASSELDSSRTAYKAIDGYTTSTGWSAASGKGAGEWLQIDFGAPTTINRTAVTEGATNITDYKIQTWNGSSWIDAVSGTTLGIGEQLDTFNPVTTSKVRLYVTGVVSGKTAAIRAFKVFNSATSAANLVQNAGLESGSLSSWSVWVPAGGSTTSAKVEAGGHSGTYRGVHYASGAPYRVSTYQNFTGLGSGLYTVKAWVMSTDNQTVSPILIVRDKSGGNVLAQTDINTVANSSTWTQITISNVNVTGTTAEVEFYSNGDAGQWIRFDDVVFYRQ
ncbi:sialate O-acetylesterase [Paenibacillus roseipurpureus]|uniref:Sialate O-acetylesterase n=1 Tax=Paenibacillus roseopurpureus TaxID=2918901 RepID=A0AA96LKY1_9BACL|nr:sialate O-acetylesterase [Paenibacillus sp. MBLB1832]WNR42991.1 sialate O-acetylesterase [Paenibacillus sp. MBLB1832]